MPSFGTAALKILLGGIPSTIQDTSERLGGSKRKWRTWRLAVGWFDAINAGLGWDYEAAKKKEWKKGMAPKWRVRQFRSTWGDEQFFLVVKAYRKNTQKETGVDLFLRKHG